MKESEVIVSHIHAQGAFKQRQGDNVSVTTHPVCNIYCSRE